MAVLEVVDAYRHQQLLDELVELHRLFLLRLQFLFLFLTVLVVLHCHLKHELRLILRHQRVGVHVHLFQLV